MPSISNMSSSETDILSSDYSHGYLAYALSIISTSFPFIIIFAIGNKELWNGEAKSIYRYSTVSVQPCQAKYRKESEGFSYREEIIHNLWHRARCQNCFYVLFSSPCSCSCCQQNKCLVCVFPSSSHHIIPYTQTIYFCSAVLQQHCLHCLPHIFFVPDVLFCCPIAALYFLKYAICAIIFV